MIYGELIYDGHPCQFTLKNRLLEIVRSDIETGGICIEYLENYLRPKKMEKQWIVGKCYPKGNKILFLISNMWGVKNTVRYQDVDFYIEFIAELESIDHIEIRSPELNAIYPALMGVDHFEYDDQFLPCNILLRKDTETEHFDFVFDDIGIQGYFCINKKISLENTAIPVEFETLLCFEFESTDDYDFVMKLVNISMRYIRFACYRNNIAVNKITLKNMESKIEIANIELLKNVKHTLDEEKTVLWKRCITYDMIASRIGNLFQKISDDEIYTLHVPENHNEMKIITPARILLLTAAFEWEFDKLFNGQEIKSQKRVEACDKAEKRIEALVNESQGEERKIYKFLKGMIRCDKLEERIRVVCKQYDSLFGIFCKQMHMFAGEALDYNEMAERIAKIRNKLAHGMIDMEIDPHVFNDIICMPDIILTMQLIRLDVEKQKIKCILNRLFQHNIYLEEKDTDE